MTRVRRLRPRSLVATALACCALLLSGCVYLRLLALKRQLAEFDTNFTLETSHGLRLGFLNPVLLSDDVRWIGLTPETAKKLGSSEQWRVRWIKQVPPGTKETGAFDLEVEMIFTDDKLTRLFIPERYFAIMPKAFVIGLLRGLGGAAVDKTARTADVNLAPSNREILTAQIVTTSLAMFLGKPTEQRMEGAHTLFRYRYTPTPPGAKNGIFDLLFTFDTAGGQLLRLDGRSPVGKMSFNFQPSP